MYFEKINKNYSTDLNMLFFIQKFLELTSYKSAESYKSSMMMVISLCEEYITIYEHDYKENHNKRLKVISDEIIDCLQNDYIAKSILNFNINEYKNNGLNDYKNSLKQMNIVKLIYRELNEATYINESIKYLNDNLTDKNKDKFVIVLNNLISYLNHIDIKNIFLFHYCKTFFEKNKNKDIKYFFEEIKKLAGEYTIYIGVDSIPEFINKDFFQKNGLEVDILTGNTGNPLKGRNKTFVFKKIYGRTPFDAIEMILNNLIDRIKWVYSVFDHKDTINIFNKTIVAKDKNGNTYKYQNNSSILTHQKKENLDKMSKKFLVFFEKFSLHENSLNRFVKATKLHNDALNSKNIENQLTFFWNALETLSVHKKEGSKLSNVESFIMPFIQKRYFIENFTYIYNTLFHSKHQELIELFSKCKLENNVNNLVKIIILDEYESFRINFYDELKNDFPLMIYKIYNMNKDLKTPEDVQKKLQKHNQRVKQQLARIYRYRNLIIHAGNNETFINILISNLHNYFDYVLDEIIAHAYKGTVKNIDEISSYMDLLISEHNNILKINTKNSNKIDDINLNKVFMLD